MANKGSAARSRVVGRYALHHEIASGGMATVHLGKLCGPVGFAPVVAIKALHPPFARTPEFVSMFLDEARLAGRIRHPNVVPVLDVHVSDAELFLVLEYIHGESLAHLIKASRRDRRPVSTGVASAILCDVLQGLHAAHEAKGERGEPLGIVHRDVSPQNILVGVDGSARVLDFGVAKASGGIHTTRDGQVKGKFAYMAPEQLRGEGVNRQADVYAAAVVLWETLVGDCLFKGESEGNTVERVLFAPVPPPSSARPDVSRALDAVVMRGLARERSERFATAKEMALALQAAEVPGSPHVVGEWVEAEAVDALEERRRLIAEVEASAASAETGDEVANIVSGLRPAVVPALPASVAADDASTSGQSVPEAQGGPRARGGRGLAWRRVALGSAAALVPLGALALWLGIHARSPAPVAAAGEVPPSSTGPPSPSPLSSTTFLVQPSGPRPSDPVGVPSPARPPSTRTNAGVRTLGAGKHVPGAAPAASPAATARCTHRNADGVIEFDTECLRAAQHAP